MIRKAPAEVVIDAPSRGLVTRIPSNQPEKVNLKGGWEEATNVRFDDGVARNAPGFADIYAHCWPADDVNLIFQETLLSGTFPSFNLPFIGTESRLYVVRRAVYTPPNLMPCEISSAEAFGTPTVSIFSTTITVPGIASAEGVGAPVLIQS